MIYHDAFYCKFSDTQDLAWWGLEVPGTLQVSIIVQTKGTEFFSRQGLYSNFLFNMLKKKALRLNEWLNIWSFSGKKEPKMRERNITHFLIKYNFNPRFLKGVLTFPGKKKLYFSSCYKNTNSWVLNELINHELFRYIKYGTLVRKIKSLQKFEINTIKHYDNFM